ncbi:MAG: type II toxin-antitoxin system PemK/MazF family toxin [Tardiphaga sp.]
MADFEQGDIIRVPFPYTDKATRQRRPALVVSSGPAGEDGALLWAVMITSSDNRPWTGDIAIRNYEDCGLPAPSVVRPFKIATIEARHADRIGKITRPILRMVMEQTQKILGIK